MKAKKVQVFLNPVSVESNISQFTKTFQYTFESSQFIDINNLEFYTEIYEPETLKEFKEHHNIPKKELLDWLNNNYK